jgi:hypothetical protein
MWNDRLDESKMGRDCVLGKRNKKQRRSLTFFITHCHVRIFRRQFFNPVDTYSVYTYCTCSTPTDDIHTYIHLFIYAYLLFIQYIHTIQTTDRIEMSDIRVYEVTVNTVHPPPVSMHIAYCHQWILHRTTMFSLFPFLCETSHTPYVQQQPRGYIHTGGKTLLLDYSTTSPDRIRTLDWS